MPAKAPEKQSVRKALIVAVVVYFVVARFVPFGHELLYPLTLLATWVHEMGHGLTALVLGGRFISLDVFANASGLARTSTSAPWQAGLVAAGGLVAPPIMGAMLLAISRGPRRAQIVLALFVAAIFLSLAIWVRSLAGWIALPLVALCLGAFVHPRWGTPFRRMVVAQLLGVVFAIDTVSRVDYLFTPEVNVGAASRQSDIASVAHAFGGHYLVWGLALSGVSFALLAIGLWLAWRKPRSLGMNARRVVGR